MSAERNGRLQRPALLVIFPGDYESSRQKGVEGQFLRFDEQGYFRKVWFVSPLRRRDRRVVLGGGVHEVLEFGLGSGRIARRLLAPFHLLRIIRRCLRLVRAEHIDLIRATEPTLCGLLAWAISHLAGVPYVVSLHADYDRLFVLDGSRGAPTLLGSRRLIRLVESFTLRHAARVFPIRDALVPYAVARGVRRENVRVIPHGIAVERFSRPPAIDVRAAFDLSAGKALVVFAGRLSPENYVEDMLAAVRRLAERREDFLFVMAGGGVLEPELDGRLRADPVLGRVVRRLGFVSQETVSALRHAAAVSLCLMGGFSLIEACAAGRPVIAYDVDWHHELVIDGVTGRLIAEHDVAAVADALGTLLDQPAEAARMGAEARSRVIARHDINRTSNIQRQWYSEVLGS